MLAWKPCTSSTQRLKDVLGLWLSCHHCCQIFSRMDDWIKDRVKEENEAIKAVLACSICPMFSRWKLSKMHLEATEALLRTGRWEDEAT